MERYKIKCPVCGHEEFILIDKPYREGMDTYIEDYTEYYACCECGLILRFAKGIVKSKLNEEFLQTKDGKRWSELNKELEIAKHSLEHLIEKEKQLKQELKDDERSIKRDKAIKEELTSIKKEIPEAEKRIKVISKELENLKK